MFLDSLAHPQRAGRRRGRPPPPARVRSRLTPGVMDLDAIEGTRGCPPPRPSGSVSPSGSSSKQLGRNPRLMGPSPGASAVRRHRLRPEARTLHATGARAGSLGHLVQIRAATCRRCWPRPGNGDGPRPGERQGGVRHAAAGLPRAGRVDPPWRAPRSPVHPQEGGSRFARDRQSSPRRWSGCPAMRIAGDTRVPVRTVRSGHGRPGPTELRNSPSRPARHRPPAGTTAPQAQRQRASMATLSRCSPSLGATRGDPATPLTGTNSSAHARDPRRPEKLRVRGRHRGRAHLADGRARGPRKAASIPARTSRQGGAAPRTGLRLPVAGPRRQTSDFYRLLDAPHPTRTSAYGATPRCCAFRTRDLRDALDGRGVAGRLSVGAPRPRRAVRRTGKSRLMQSKTVIVVVDGFGVGAMLRTPALRPGDVAADTCGLLLDRCAEAFGRPPAASGARRARPRPAHLRTTWPGARICRRSPRAGRPALGYPARHARRAPDDDAKARTSAG